MALYELTQRVDFLYIHEYDAIYVKATANVELTHNESILAPPQEEITFNSGTGDITIKLRVVDSPSTDGRDIRRMPVTVKVIDTNYEAIPDIDDIIATIGNNIYNVTTTVIIYGNPGGTVTTTSENAEIEIL